MSDPAVRREVGGVPLIAVPLVPPIDPIEISVTLDRSLFDAIGDAAKAQGMSKAAFLVEAAREKIAS
jgi:hypothetical protein